MSVSSFKNPVCGQKNRKVKGLLHHQTLIPPRWLYLLTIESLSPILTLPTTMELIPTSLARRITRVQDQEPPLLLWPMHSTKCTNAWQPISLIMNDVLQFHWSYSIMLCLFRGSEVLCYHYSLKKCYFINFIIK